MAASLSNLDCQTAEPAAHPTARVTIEKLIAEYGAFVWRSVRRLGVPQADVDDVVQVVFLRARERISEIQPNAAKGFLYRLAFGFASNHRRSQRRRRETSLAEEGVLAMVEKKQVDSPVARIEQRALLDRLLLELPMDLRAVLVLHEGEELTAPEIAELLGIPVGTVASRLRRAREEMKGILLRARLKNPDLGGLP